MKKIFALAIIAAVLLYGNQANARVRRVGYFGNALAGTDYADLQSAHDDAKTNDTILLFPGNWSANIRKKIGVLGYGYFVAGNGANAGLQNITGPISVIIGLFGGADGSVYEGID